MALLTLSDLYDLRSGYREHIWVGEIPYPVAQQLGLRNHNVYLSQRSLDHILDDHSDIDMFTLLHLPLAVKRGMLVQERKHPRTVMVCYQDPESYRRYVIALKVAAQECEVWVSSFYRGKRRQTKRILARGEMLKTHD